MKRLVILSLAIALYLYANAQSCTYRNPVIPGYHPDPSVCRVGNEFYLVNSTFQYFPGVPIFKSKDLVHWKQIGNVLTRDSQLSLKDATSWTGIYAPTIRYHNATWYMITTNVNGRGNFMVTAKKPEGPWSEPIWLEQQGIDPSLFFDQDRCYMCSNPDDAIYLCEIDPKTGKQLTASKKIWEGTGGRYVEGPHIYFKDGYYYLLCSEGGTEMAHSLTIARSKNIYGPYESNPANPILTNCNFKGQYKQIQGTGHGDLVRASDGSWWITFLAYRNFGGAYHHLGRETYLAPVTWEQGQWPVINNGEAIDTLMTANLLEGAAKPVEKVNIGPEIDLNNPQWLHIQNPIAENYENKDGQLKLVGHGTLSENNQPTFVGVRQTSENFKVETEISNLSELKKMGSYGLTIYQINDGHVDFCINNGFVLLKLKLKSIDTTLDMKELPEDASKVKLEIVGNEKNYCFYATVYNAKGEKAMFYELTDKGTETTCFESVDCSLLSTEVAGGFTGVVLGMFSEYEHQDAAALFNYFKYTEK